MVTTTDTPTTRSGSHHLRKALLGTGLAAVVAGTATLSVAVFRDDTSSHVPAVVVPAPYNGLPNLEELGVTYPSATVCRPEDRPIVAIDQRPEATGAAVVVRPGRAGC
jgi:hypothetical protein